MLPALLPPGSPLTHTHSFETTRTPQVDKQKLKEREELLTPREKLLRDLRRNNTETLKPGKCIVAGPECRELAYIVRRILSWLRQHHPECPVLSVRKAVLCRWQTVLGRIGNACRGRLHRTS